MISSFSVRNYRGIKSCRVEGLKRVNVFIGKNNSGKSLLLESLYLASAAFHFEEPLKKISSKVKYLLNRRCWRGYSWGSAREVLWYEYDTENPISIRLTTGAGEVVVDVFDWHPHPLVKYQQDRGADHVCLIESSYYSSKTKSGYGRFPPSDVRKVFGEWISFFSGFRFIDSVLVQEMDVVEKKLWNDLLKKRYDKLVVEVLREGYGVEVEDLTYTTYDEGRTYQLAVKLPRTSIRVDDLGDGARYAVLLVMVSALSRNTVLLIEEPESHQHPSGLAKTLDMFLTLVKENNIQVFITTHSLELLRLLKGISEEKKIDVRIFFLERSEEGVVDVRELAAENMKVLEEMGFDPRFLYLI